MSWGAWILAIVYPVSLVTAMANLDEAQAERAAAFAGRFGLGRLARAARSFGLAHASRLRWASIVTGAALGVYTGVLLSTLGARALWSSALLGPLFLVSGFSTGAALLLLFRLSEEERHLLARWDRLAMALELVVLLLFLAGLATSGAAGKAAAGLLLGGAFTAPFWTLVVLAGLVVPSLLAALESRRGLPMTVAQPALVLAGGLALRWILVAAGQA
jgi:formate-dependent nitrite reductase membrane component NrfD